MLHCTVPIQATVSLRVMAEVSQAAAHAATWLTGLTYTHSGAATHARVLVPDARHRMHAALHRAQVCKRHTHPVWQVRAFFTYHGAWRMVASAPRYVQEALLVNSTTGGTVSHSGQCCYQWQQLAAGEAVLHCSCTRRADTSPNHHTRCHGKQLGTANKAYAHPAHAPAGNHHAMSLSMKPADESNGGEATCKLKTSLIETLSTPTDSSNVYCIICLAALRSRPGQHCRSTPSAASISCTHTTTSSDPLQPRTPK